MAEKIEEPPGYFFKFLFMVCYEKGGDNETAG